MKKNMIAALVVGVAAVAALALALGVSAWGGESTETAKAELCEGLTDLSSTVMSYEGLDPATATTDELDAAAEDIDDAWDEVVDEAYDWVYAEDNALTDAYDDLYYAIEGLPGDLTVAESLEELEPELSAFPSAYSQTFDRSGCDTV